MERSPLRIMVIDSEALTLSLHQHILAELGFASTRTFQSGESALAHFSQGSGHPDVILLDLSMKRMDGIGFARQLVTKGYCGKLILASNEGDRVVQASIRLVQECGVAVLGHVSKPATPEQLRALLKDWQPLPPTPPPGIGRIFSRKEIAEGLQRSEFVNHYQPKVSPRTGEVEGVESLVRWDRPGEGLIPPGAFLGSLVREGFMDELTRVSFRSALSHIHGLAMEGFSLHLAFNLTAATLADVEFASFVAEEAARASVRADHIILEVTESQIIKDLRAPLEVLTRLRLLHVGVSIDDFGTGYSSLTQLQNLPFDELKIDQSFVHRAARDSMANAIYEASLQLARGLEMKAVAEGVEDRADWDLVRRSGCDLAQGYFIGRPMPASGLMAWRESWKQRTVTELGLV
ncbi:MAG: EAL domain-containing response regulator [Vicinamibacteria bacterium]